MPDYDKDRGASISPGEKKRRPYVKPALTSEQMERASGLGCSKCEEAANVPDIGGCTQCDPILFS